MRCSAILRNISQTASSIKAEVAAINTISPQAFWFTHSTLTSTELRATYKFKSFTKTWQFLNMVAAQAHILRHHPTITTTYNKVEITVTTHDVGNQLTYKDTKLARAIQQIYFEKFSDTTKVGPSPTSAMNKAFEIIDDLTKRETNTDH